MKDPIYAEMDKAGVLTPEDLPHHFYKNHPARSKIDQDIQTAAQHHDNVHDALDFLHGSNVGQGVTQEDWTKMRPHLHKVLKKYGLEEHMTDTSQIIDFAKGDEAAKIKDAVERMLVQKAAHAIQQKRTWDEPPALNDLGDGDLSGAE